MSTTAQHQYEAMAESQTSVEDLPITFKVKYLGSRSARGLWGIKHTRRPVDQLVTLAKNMTTDQAIPFSKLTVSTDGVTMEPHSVKARESKSVFSIDTISYGVQDLIFTRVFAMIIVKENDKENPFEVHAFVCDSRATARALTFALAAAFKDYSLRVKEAEENQPTVVPPMRKKFAIDLRTPEEMLQELDDQETEA